MTETGEVRATRRGDVDRRRRDVLDAAAQVLDERRGSGFSMREVAERAGISAGAVYQWFTGKAEILAVLHNLRFEEERQRVAGLPDDPGLEATVTDILTGMATIWAETGHHRSTIIDSRDGTEADRFLEGLAEGFRDLSVCIEDRLRAAAATEGITLRPAEVMMPWFWAVCIGAGSQLIDVRFIGEGGPARYLATLAGPTAAGLVVRS